MSTCTQPGCTGEIQDGYCNVCGMAGATGAPPVPSPGPVPATGASGGPAVVDGSACTQPGCGGSIEYGYCNTCGMAAAPSPAVATGSGQPGAVAAVGEEVSVATSASRVQSAAFGSER
ncbi:MAG: serine/threonine protein kinase, partial [Pimelobacter sp.]|nr:serine/threonine protein kinase [Pimelobacter sp.]